MKRQDQSKIREFFLASVKEVLSSVEPDLINKEHISNITQSLSAKLIENTDLNNEDIRSTLHQVMGDITVEYLQEYSRAILTIKQSAAASKQTPAPLPGLTPDHFFTDEILISLNPAEAITRFEDKERGYFNGTKIAFSFLRQQLSLNSDEKRWCIVLKLFHGKLMQHTKVKHSAQNTTDFDLVPGKSCDEKGMAALFNLCQNPENCFQLEISYDDCNYLYAHPAVLSRFAKQYFCQKFNALGVASELLDEMLIGLPKGGLAIFLNDNFEEGFPLSVSKLISDFIKQENPAGDISGNGIKIKLVSCKKEAQRLAELETILVDLLGALQSLDRGDAKLNRKVIANMAHHMQRVLQLHPFADGNARFAYLLTNVILEKFGLIPSFFPFFMSIFDANSQTRMVELIIQGQQLFKNYFKVDSLQTLLTLSYKKAEQMKAAITQVHEQFRNGAASVSRRDIITQYTQLIQYALSSWQHSAHRNAFALLILKCMRNRVMLCPKPKKTAPSRSATPYGKAFHQFYQQNELSSVPKIQAYYDQRKAQIPR